MRQEVFVARYATEWDALERWLGDVGERRGRGKAPPPAASAGSDFDEPEFPARYRRLCQQLALARCRGYSPAVLDRLQSLMQRGHQALYRTPPPRWRRAVDRLLAGFPRLVRAQAGCMALAAALLFVPMTAMIGALQWRPELAQSLFSPAEQAQFERMYDPSAERIGRDSGDDLQMFGHYVWNNVSIGFRTFASGLAAGIGSIVVLVMNGMVIGGVAGHLTAIGYGGPFWRFVAGHSSLELTAVVICGGAGLRVGLALIAPGRKTRAAAVVEAGAIGAELALGAFAMLVAAAFVEAFWSSRTELPDALRFGVAGLLWLLVLGWLWRGGAGRTDDAP